MIIKKSITVVQLQTARGRGPPPLARFSVVSLHAETCVSAFIIHMDKTGNGFLFIILTFTSFPYVGLNHIQLAVSHQWGLPKHFWNNLAYRKYVLDDDFSFSCETKCPLNKRAVFVLLHRYTSVIKIRCYLKFYHHRQHIQVVASRAYIILRHHLQEGLGLLGSPHAFAGSVKQAELCPCVRLDNN